MTEKEYFKVSEEAKLPKRCPILNECERRMITIYFFSFRDDFKNVNIYELLKKHQIIEADYSEKMIKISGEEPYVIGGNSSHGFYNCCPEIPLFDSSHRPAYIKTPVACTSGNYDSEFRENKFSPSKMKHFSECSEFSSHQFRNKSTSNKKKRLNISLRTKMLLQKEIKSECPFCKNDDVEHFQVHHINNIPTDNQIENLLMLCPLCHSKITKGNITISQVVSLKKQLTQSMSKH